ncbi:MAG: transcription-repair coupling factor [Acidobacteriota bacterium]
MDICFINKNKRFKNLLNLIESGERGLHISGLNSTAKSYVLAILQKELNRKILLIHPTAFSSEEYLKKIKPLSKLILNKEDETFVLPPSIINPYHEPATPWGNLSQRMKFFYAMQTDTISIGITPWIGILKPFLGLNDVRNLFIEIITGYEYDRETLIKKLKFFGYKEEDLTTLKEEFSWRGGILDVFSPWENYPFRIEFEDEIIRSVRYFDPSSQRSIKKIEEAIIPSFFEIPVDEDSVTKWIKLSNDYWGNASLKEKLEDKINILRKGEISSEFIFLFLILKEKFISPDVFFRDFLFVLDEKDQIEQEIEDHIKNVSLSIESAKKNRELVLPINYIFSFDFFKNIEKNGIFFEEISPGDNKFYFNFQTSPKYKGNIPIFIEDIKRGIRNDENYIFLIKSEYKSKRLHEAFEDYSIFNFIESSNSKSKLLILRNDLSEGFSFSEEKINILTENDLFGEIELHFRRSYIKPFTSSFRDIKIGNFIVHSEHGIGIFNGLKNVRVDSQIHELMEILYRDGDKLLLPLYRLDLIHLYKSGTSPVLDKLGGVTWERVKSRVKKAIKEMAVELLNLYAMRKTIKGHAYSGDSIWQREFEESFEFEETEDQERAIKEIKKDMEAIYPMDRLLCGDVGYGKTEVAIRAAFKAIMDGKQVVLLCPTTILAFQHYNTFKKRFTGYPVRIEMLSRLQKKSEQKKITDDLGKGLVDIVIGTHRLLSSDLKYKDLGLLIVDEEQRFGVSHKEKIKKLKTKIDVLTMTATPIPRTLNMTLMGMRDLSLIETPPKDRLSIQTIVTNFSKEVIYEAIKRELGRRGQVYFVHNRIENLNVIHSFLSRLVPEAKIAIMHGKMKGSQIEDIMMKFINHEYDILVSTTIIENGIDIPLVNTLIVNRADMFGLAQLYQLRGRVGRSDRQAYAYFLAPSMRAMNYVAKKRLRALQEFSELGSSFRLAAMDLEIRGAGNLLGERQHGHIGEVGFDYYIKLIEETVRELRGIGEAGIISEIDLKMELKIPEDFIPEMSQRIYFYKKISSVKELEEIEKIREEVEDRYGKVPPEFVDLLKFGEIKYLAQTKEIERIERVDSSLKLKFVNHPKFNTEKLIELVKLTKGRITPEEEVILSLKEKEKGSILDEIKNLLKSI